VELKKIPEDKIELGKKYVRRLVEKFKNAQENLKSESASEEKWKDEAYYRAMDSFEEEPLPETLKGIAHIGE
jgi:hypothetical protein